MQAAELAPQVRSNRKRGLPWLQCPEEAGGRARVEGEPDPTGLRPP